MKTLFAILFASPLLFGQSKQFNPNQANWAIPVVGQAPTLPGVQLAGSMTTSYKVGATAVSANTLVDIDSNGNVVPNTKYSGLGAVGVALQSGASGASVPVAFTGPAQCLFTGATTAGDMVLIDATAYSECRDSGAFTSIASLPNNTQVRGIVAQTIASAGVANVILFPVGIWGQSTADSNAPNRGIFYVADFQASVDGAGYTQYDEARKAADLYASANPNTGSVVVLMPGYNYTCIDAPLPAFSGSVATTSIVGYGGGGGAYQSMIDKQASYNGYTCPVQGATLSHPATGDLSIGLYANFLVNAEHYDNHACDFWGIKETPIQNVGCFSAGLQNSWIASFGSPASGSSSWCDNCYVNNFTTGDQMGGGNGFQASLTWSGTSLSSVNAINTSQQKDYSTLNNRLFFVGPGIAQCSILPAATPINDSSGGTEPVPNVGTLQFGVITGATITNAGNCSAAAQAAGIYVIAFDTTPMAEDIYFGNTADSYYANLYVTGGGAIAELISNISGANTFYQEHPCCNMPLAEIDDQGTGNRHYGTEFDSPAYVSAILDGPTGLFDGATIAWNATYYADPLGYWGRFSTGEGVNNWVVVDSGCPYTSDHAAYPNFQLYVNGGATSGPSVISQSNPVDAGVAIVNSQICNGSNAVVSMKGANSSAVTRDQFSYEFAVGDGDWFNTSATLPTAPLYGLHPNFINGNDMLLLRNFSGGGSIQDAVGIDSAGNLSAMAGYRGDLIVNQVAAPAAPISVAPNTAGGSTSYSYACEAVTKEGLTVPGPTTATATGQAALSSTVYNTVVCPYVSGASAINVVRQANGGGYSAGVAACQISEGNALSGRGCPDTGSSSGTASASNTTGQLCFKSSSGAISCGASGEVLGFSATSGQPAWIPNSSTPPVMTGICQGTATASTSAIYLFGLGSATANSCTDTAPVTGFVMPYSAILSLLTVRCWTSGANSSSGVFVVHDTPTGTNVQVTTGLTVTYGATAPYTSLQDATHTYSASAGDLITLSFSTQAAETLGGCSASIQY